MAENIKIGRREFLFSAVASGIGCSVPAAESARLDDSLSVLISDMHVGGPGSNRVHQKWLLSAVVDRILEMRPLPRRVIGFGDLAFLHGLKCDYDTSYPILKRLADAGIEVYNGLGNHDRRSAFFGCYAEDAKRSLVPGYAVYRIETPHVDFVMLDSLNEDASSPRKGYGEFPVDVQKWMMSEIPRMKGPVILAAHHPLDEMRVGDRPFRSFLASSQNVVGYIYGHEHCWRPGWITCSYKTGRIMRTLSLPSTGHWGDIGYVTFRTTPDVATATLHQSDFFFLTPQTESPSSTQNLYIQEDNRQGCTCRFSLKVHMTAKNS